MRLYLSQKRFEVKYPEQVTVRAIVLEDCMEKRRRRQCFHCFTIVFTDDIYALYFYDNSGEVLMAYRILVVDDDRSINKMIKDFWRWKNIM